jgi:hypothetical protein
VILLDYIVAAQGGLHSFYRKGGGLFWREFAGGRWSLPVCFKERGVISFRVSLCDDKILIVSGEAAGAEYIFFHKGAFIARELVNGNMKGQYYGIALGEDMCLIHNVPVNGEGSQILMSHRITPAGVWQNSRHLGRFVPFSEDYPFYVVPIANRHFLLFYRAFDGDLVSDEGLGVSDSGAEDTSLTDAFSPRSCPQPLGYREVFGPQGLVGEFNAVMPASDIPNKYLAFLATKFGLHLVYKTDTALVYKERGANGLSSAVPIVFGRDIHSPLLYMHENTLHLMFKRRNDFFVCNFSENGISSPLRLKGPGASIVTHAQFLQDDNSKESFAFIANELPVNAQNPWKIHPYFLNLIVERE